MKKFILIITIIFLGVIGYVVYVEKTKDKIIPLTIEKELVEINNYYVYGRTLNLSGEVTIEDLKYDTIDLVLYNNKEFKSYEINYKENINTISFNMSTLINEGILLDDIEKGDYQILLRLGKKEQIEENNETKETTTYKYYSLENKTEYKNTTYYTMSKYNNKIVISTNNNIMNLSVTENQDNEIYDIVVDAGHGGKDPGAVIGDKKEKDYTIMLAKVLKEKLEGYGFKVKLTRTDNSLKETEYFEEYGKNGRAEISHEVFAKYVISLHLNSNVSVKVNGLELYTPGDINYDLAKSMVENITKKTSMSYSPQKTFKVYNGIYTHNFTENEITAAKEREEAKKRNAYDITTKSNYLYIIRETGGIMTGAYVDDRNEDQTANTYYKSNIGAEAYLFEVAYLSSESDINIIKTEKDEYMDAIALSLKNYLKY